MAACVLNVLFKGFGDILFCNYTTVVAFLFVFSFGFCFALLMSWKMTKVYRIFEGVGQLWAESWVVLSQRLCSVWCCSFAAGSSWYRILYVIFSPMVC